MTDMPPSKALVRTLGNVWQLQQDDDAFFYMSDQWQGRVFGFEQRERVTLAQSPEVAIGVVAFGGGSIGVTRPLPDRMKYHLRDESLEVHEWDLAAEASAVAFLRHQDENHHALSTVIAVSEPIPSCTERDALEGARGRRRIRNRLKKAKNQLDKWGKFLFVDRIHLSLLDGTPDVKENVADFHYAAAANGIRLDVTDATGQAGLPLIVVSQGAGFSDKGDSEVILAEGRLHWNHFDLGLVVATPTYRFKFMEGTRGTLDPADAMIVSEMESRAIEARHAGQEWYCPSLEEATVEGNLIKARFASMTDLGLEEGFHGFKIDGVEITSVSTEGVYVIIETKTPAQSGMTLKYAWDGEASTDLTRPANQGALRDNWEAQSRFNPERTLHRFALSGRAILRTPS